jgi:PAS domain S-box-containing protein
MSKPRSVSRLCAFVAVVLGVTGLAGWIFHIPALKTLIPGLVTIKANTAVCLIALGASLLLLEQRPVNSRSRKAATLLAGFAAVIGLVSLLEHLINADFGIDQLLFRESLAEAGQSFPGRMGPATCISFMLLGSSLVLLDYRTSKGIFLAPYLTVCSLPVTFLAALAYFYGAQPIAALTQYISIAFHTVIALLSLCVGILMARGEREFVPSFLGYSPGAVLARRLLPASLLLPAFLGWLSVLARNANYYGAHYGTAWVVAVLTFVFSVLVCVTAAGINRADEGRKKAEQALDTARRQLLGALNGARVVAWEWDLKTGRSNRFGPVQELLGIEHESAEEFFVRIHPQDQSRLRELARRAIAGEIPYDFEFRYLNAHGDIIWLHTLAEVIRDANGHPSTVSGLVIDITTQKQSAEALRESEEKFVLLFQKAPFPAALSNLSQGTFSDVNEAFERVSGFSRDEVLGKSSVDLGFVPGSGSRKAFREELLKFGSIRNREMRLRVRSGAERVALVNIDVIQIAGQPYALSTTQDITERKAAEEALRESEERFRQLAENIPQLAWMTNADGWIFWYNKRWFDYTGTTLEEMQGWGWQKVHHPEHVARVTEKFKGALASGQPWEDTFPLRGANGSFRWFLSRAFPIHNANGQIARWFGSNTDITELRETQEALQQAQADLREHAANLERAIADRTAQLRATIGELEAFSYSVSHDMRGPLRAITAYAKVVEEDFAAQLPDQARSYLANIISAATRMDQLITDVLAYGRVGREHRTLEPVDLGQLVAEVISHYTSLQPAQADIQVQSPLPVVLGDQPSLAQCVSNLLTNAVKFVSPGVRPAVRIWSEPVNGDSSRSNRVRIYFADNGIGIASRDIARIFGIFERVHPPNTYEGTGIGLAIVKKAVERMGGQVGVESNPAKGSRFWLELDTP